MLLKDFDVIQSQSAQIILVALYLLNRFVNPSLLQLITLQDEEDSTSSKMPHYAVLGKRHECSLCGRKFNRIDALKRHVKQVHERRAAQREYVCNTCGEVFHNLAPFRAHGKSAHSKPSTTAKRPRQDDSGRKTLLQYQNNILYKLNDKYYVNFLCKA